jgi:hypothetical protein
MDSIRTLGKGAVEGSARFDVDRFGEVEPNDFRARVICQGRDGEGHHGLLPREKPAPIASGSEGACSVQYELRGRSHLAARGRSLSLLVKLAYIQ